VRSSTFVGRQQCTSCRLPCSSHRQKSRMRIGRVQKVTTNSYGHFIFWFIFTLLFATSGIAVCGPTGFYRYDINMTYYMRCIVLEILWFHCKRGKVHATRIMLVMKFLCFYTAAVFAIGLGVFLKEFLKIGFIREVWIKVCERRAWDAVPSKLRCGAAKNLEDTTFGAW